VKKRYYTPIDGQSAYEPIATRIDLPKQQRRSSQLVHALLTVQKFSAASDKDN